MITFYRVSEMQGLEISVLTPRVLPTDVGRNLGKTQKIVTSGNVELMGEFFLC